MGDTALSLADLTVSPKRHRARDVGLREGDVGLQEGDVGLRDGIVGFERLASSIHSRVLSRSAEYESKPEPLRLGGRIGSESESSRGHNGRERESLGGLIGRRSEGPGGHIGRGRESLGGYNARVSASSQGGLVASAMHSPTGYGQAGGGDRSSFSYGFHGFR